VLGRIHPEVLARYYGCGLVSPPLLEGCRVLDLGCGSGRDVYALAQLVGERGEVVGVDMTPEQLAVARRHEDYHREAFGFARSNVRFLEGYIERLGELGQRFLDGTQPSLEAQLANLADEIAYNNHDVDDGLRSGLITLEQLDEVPIFAVQRREAEARWSGLSGLLHIHETVRRMIHLMVIDLIEQTRANIAAEGVATLADVHAAPRLVAYSDALLPRLRELKVFLRDKLYRHYQVLRMTNKARRIVGDLFTAFTDDPHILPPQYQAMAREDKPRAIADYIAGMTDRYASREHARLTGERLWD